MCEKAETPFVVILFAYLGLLVSVSLRVRLTLCNSPQPFKCMSTHFAIMTKMIASVAMKDFCQLALPACVVLS